MVGAGIAEIPMLAAAVSHAAVVESQRGDAGRGKRAAQQHELPVAAGPVLRAKCGAAAIEAEYFIEHAQDFLSDVQWGAPGRRCWLPWGF